ncbi:MAG: adenylyl-sulfate kinase [Chromatiales bacterium]|nr:adenylyl-sulfate kinase [Chromatiales bacterium]
MSDNNLVWHHATVTRTRRERANGHRGAVVWLTGLSGAGKSTVAHALEETLFRRGCRTYVFDGDNVRHGLCSDLGFSEDDRSENIRRIGEMTKLFVDAGIVAITAFISPFRADRQRVRSMFAHGDFYEVYCRCSLEICEQRDVKGLYARARAGEIAHFTGISSPYEEPETPELSVDTGDSSLDETVAELLELLEARGVIARPTRESATITRL